MDNLVKPHGKDKKLKPLLLGADPLATEALSDQMWRLDRHGRSGYFAMGASAVVKSLDARTEPARTSLFAAAAA